MLRNHFNLIFEGTGEIPGLENRIREWGRVIFGMIGAGEGRMNLMLCGSESISQLNARFRDDEKATDVLSWSYYDEPEDGILLGEIAVCVEVCSRQAEENGWPFETELARLMVHGVAHVVGFDHDTQSGERDMLDFEKKVLHRLSFPNLYPENPNPK